MRTIVELAFIILNSPESLRRLPNEYQRMVVLCRLGTCLSNFKCQQKSMRVALLFWGANCIAQGLVTSGPFARPSAQPSIAAGQTTLNATAESPLTSGAFIYTAASSTRPSRLISMLEARPLVGDRPILSIPTNSSLEGNHDSRYAIYRFSPTAASAKAVISARESVSLDRPQELAPPTMAFENASSVNAEETAEKSDEDKSPYSLLFWPKQGSGGWAKGLDVSRESTTQSQEGGLYPGGNPSGLKPLTIVGLGSYSLPVSFYVPVLRDESPIR